MDPHQLGATVSDMTLTPRQRILNAALMLITERGLSGVTMTALAKAAGVSRQTLYNNFPDVESVVAEMVSQHNSEALQQLDASLHMCPTPSDKVIYLARHFAALGGHGHASQIEHGLSAVAQSQLADYEEAVNGRIQATLEEGMRSGEFRGDLVPGTDSVLLHFLFKGAQTASAQAPDEATAIAQTTAHTALAALSG